MTKITEQDVENRITSDWAKWRALSDVAVTEECPLEQRVIRPVLLYGPECWTTIKNNEQRMHVKEMKEILRWSN